MANTESGSAVSVGNAYQASFGGLPNETVYQRFELKSIATTIRNDTYRNYLLSIAERRKEKR